MKTLLTFILLLPFLATSQLIGGQILLDQRPLAEGSTVVFEDAVQAELVYQIMVDLDGTIKWAQIDWNRSTKIGTPAEVRAMKHLKSIRLEKGTGWPMKHYGEIRIKLIVPQKKAD